METLFESLKRRGVKLTPADPEAVRAYRERVRQHVIPEIIRYQRQQAILRAKHMHRVLF